MHRHLLKCEVWVNIKNDSVCSFERLQALSNWFQIEISNLGKKIYKLFVMQFSITNFERTILLESSVFISKDLLCNRCNHNMFVYSLKENNSLYSLYYSYCGICGVEHHPADITRNLVKGRKHTECRNRKDRQCRDKRDNIALYHCDFNNHRKHQAADTYRFHDRFRQVC